MSSFDAWFKRATENDPFPYQRRFAEGNEISQLVDVPTGLDKTAMAVYEMPNNFILTAYQVSRR